MQTDQLMLLYAIIGGLVALAIAFYYNGQQKAIRISQLQKELRHLTEQLESAQQQLKITEKLYEGATPSLLPSRPSYATAAD